MTSNSNTSSSSPARQAPGGEHAAGQPSASTDRPAKRISKHRPLEIKRRWKGATYRNSFMPEPSLLAGLHVPWSRWCSASQSLQHGLGSQKHSRSDTRHIPCEDRSELRDAGEPTAMQKVQTAPAGAELPKDKKAFLGGSLCRQELDSMILTGPFHLWVLCDSMKALRVCRQQNGKQHKGLREQQRCKTKRGASAACAYRLHTPRRAHTLGACFKPSSS